MGTPKDAQEKLFNLFTQIDSSNTRQREGTGLGLFITKSLVHEMKGSLSFESTEGKGTTFTIKFEYYTQ